MGLQASGYGWSHLQQQQQLLKFLVEREVQSIIVTINRQIVSCKKQVIPPPIFLHYLFPLLYNIVKQNAIGLTKWIPLCSSLMLLAKSCFPIWYEKF